MSAQHDELAQSAIQQLGGLDGFVLSYLRSISWLELQQMLETAAQLNHETMDLHDEETAGFADRNQPLPCSTNHVPHEAYNSGATNTSSLPSVTTVMDGHSLTYSSSAQDKSISFYSVPDSHMSVTSEPSFSIITAQNSLVPLSAAPIETGPSMNHPPVVVPDPPAFFPGPVVEDNLSKPHTTDAMNSSSSTLNEGFWSDTSLPDRSDMSYTSLPSTNIEISAERHDFGPQLCHFKILESQQLQRISKTKHSCICPYPSCGKTLSSEDSFRSHVREFHERRAILTCLHCQAEANKKTIFTLDKRFKGHHNTCHRICKPDVGPGGLPTCVKQDHLPLKTFFGCRFCVSGFKSLDLYMKHLYRKHSDPHPGNASPSHNILILSLLTRPGVSEVWQAITASRPLYSWPESDVANLIRDLEVFQTDRPGENPRNVAEQLAWRAFRLATKADTTFRVDSAWDWSQPIANVPQPNLCLPDNQTLLRSKRSRKLRNLIFGPLSVDDNNAIIRSLQRDRLI